MNNSFGVNIIPDNEEDRLNKLYNYKIFDTESEGSFKHIAALAAHVFKMPIALISFVDATKVLFKGNKGMEGVTEVDRGISLCSLAIMKEGATVFRDALLEKCLLSNPLVAGEFGLRFYAAVPLRTHDGFNLGSFCLVDRVPREFTPEDQITLEYMAKLVMDELELLKCRQYIENRKLA